MSEVQQKVMPCLGRPFFLGMLYDCRTDKLVPGVTLWDEDTIAQTLDRRHKATNSASLISEDSVKSKSDSLNVEAGLSLSALGGLVKVSGSAKYMNDNRTSQKQVRVTLKYSMTSHFEQMTMKALATKNIQYKDVFDKHTATHVVTGVEYGVQAFFVFNHTVSDNENDQEISGTMKIAVNKIPSVSIEGEGSLDMKGKKKDLVDNLQCKFIGDINLGSRALPTTFEEALGVYKDLPKIIMGDTKPGEYPINVVPQKVWLYPLNKLDSKAAKLVRDISATIVSQVQSVIEDLQGMEMKSSDLQGTKICKYFLGIKNQLETFSQMVSVHKLDIMKQIVTLLPQIRGGGKEEEALATVLRNHEASAFSLPKLTSWMDEKTQEIDVLEALVSGLSDCQAIQFALSPGELDKKILRMDIDNVLCFMFTLPENNDPSGILKKMTTENKMDNQDVSKAPSNMPWYSKRKQFGDMLSKAKAFKELAEANTKEESVIFIVSQTEPEKLEDCGAEISCYNGGSPVADFKVPNKPPFTPKALCIQHDSIQLEWPKLSPKENASYTMIMYQAKGDGRNQWPGKKVLKVSHGNSITLSGLKPDTAYRFKIQARYGIGISRDSDRSGPIVTGKNVTKMRLKGNYKQAAGVYTRKKDKAMGRYAWVCEDENVKKCIVYHQPHDHWAIDDLSHLQDIIDEGKAHEYLWYAWSKDGPDVPYEADWSPDFTVSEVMLANDKKWMPLDELDDN